MTTNTDTRELSGRRALVTGGSRGIGAGIAQRLLAAGATVAVSARHPAETTPAGAAFIRGDLSTEQGAAALAEAAAAQLGGVDILVNNAGAARPHLGGVLRSIVEFLVSDRASWITGSNLVIDGGQNPVA
jgi:NAD(P)-dependent dehydrogenase (short-subunit alcohol dehydrogenase family)